MEKMFALSGSGGENGVNLIEMNILWDLEGTFSSA
jgi:hypothetical protein